MFHCEAAETFCRVVIVVQSTASLLMFNDLFVFSHLLLWLLTACFMIQLTVIFHLSHTPTLHEKYNSYSLHHYKMSETLSKFCRSETQRYSMMQHREKKNILTVERLEQLYKYLNDQLSTWQSLTWLMDQSRWRTVTELFKTCCNFSLPTIFISKAENKIYLKSLSPSVLVPLVTTLWPTAGSWPSVWTALIRTGGSCKSRWLLFLFSPLRLPLRAQLFLVWMWSQSTFRWNFSALWFLRWDLHVCIDLDFFSESTCLNRTWVDTIRRPKGTILMNPDTLKYRHADRQTGRFRRGHHVF